MTTVGRPWLATAGAAIGALSVTVAFWLVRYAGLDWGFGIALALLGIGLSILFTWYNVRYSESLVATTEDNRAPSIDSNDSAHQADYATMIAELAAAAAKQVNEVRMPIHILLNTEFGQLDENQEELLSAAEVALEELSNQLDRVREIADADGGALRVQSEPVRVGSVLRGLEPMVRSLATKMGVTVVFDTEPALPRGIGDTPRLRDALRLTLSDAVRYAVPGTTVRVCAKSNGEEILVVVDHGCPHANSAGLILADRLVDAQGGSIAVEEGRTTVSIRRFGTMETRAEASGSLKR